VAQLRQLAKEEEAVVGEGDLTGTRETTVVPRLPPMRPASAMEWCGERKGRRESSAWPGGSRPAIE
jgi:hypothetical protein